MKHIKHIKGFVLNEKLNVTSDIDYHNRGNDTDISEYFPEFYKSNKERVDSGRIKFFYDGFATEVGCLIDLDTLETYIIDMRA